MEIERIFNKNTNITFQDTLNSLINEEIDKLVSLYYSQDKVNTTTSHVEGKEVS
ncbi:hypothetical protein [Peribacillus asahii]|uniref:Uncharacterized protein n=1 Tax=Peribacillus asahii TaxID=228899 RepID=A0A3T0KRS8_9BACI|nr:hypothetical protein [Peribacillus asahii]AZV43106.1 hypothetical protein BAOM_2497 [Peribacillus asahii]USK83218.1 hypothetical protein LIT35_11940 [Peribacillus asahii]